jgi:hypothetical protein
MGAWGHRAFDNDTGEDWLDGFSDVLKFILMQAYWSHFQEEGIAAARLLMDLPQLLQDRLGPHPFAEALECVEAELKPQAIKPWKHPQKRRRYLRVLRGALIQAYEFQTKLDQAHRDRISKLKVIRVSGNDPRKPKRKPKRRVAKPS